ncbi:hypothetical protein Lal_00015660 [Lupinus albus]|nr:hypothetical protein Lal_00015660 [Lupinus albus]
MLEYVRRSDYRLRAKRIRLKGKDDTIIIKGGRRFSLLLRKTIPLNEKQHISSLYYFEYEKENRRQRDSLRIGMLTIDSLFFGLLHRNERLKRGRESYSDSEIPCLTNIFILAHCLREAGNPLPKGGSLLVSSASVVVAPAKAVHDWEDAKALLLAYEVGGLFLALYLKQCASSLQIAYGGDRRPHDRLPVPVSLTRKGGPSRQPGGRNAAPVGGEVPTLGFKDPLDEGVTWEPTWKAIPNSPYLSQQLRFPTIESEL